MQAIVDGLAVQFERSGSGRQILLLHGWADSGRTWRKFASVLAKQFEVIVPSMPGFGGSEVPASEWGIEEYAVFVEAFIKKLELKPYAVIGHSNGGAIALAGIAHGKFRPTRLILLASAGIRDQAKGRKRLLWMVAKVGKVVVAPLPISVKRRLRRGLYRTAGSDMLVADHMQETFKRVVAYDVQSDAQRVGIPTLLIYGDSDTATPPRYGELLKGSMQDARLERIPGVGHFVHLEAEDVVLRLTKEFLA